MAAAPLTSPFLGAARALREPNKDYSDGCADRRPLVAGFDIWVVVVARTKLQYLVNDWPCRAVLACHYCSQRMGGRLGTHVSAASFFTLLGDA